LPDTVEMTYLKAWFGEGSKRGYLAFFELRGSAAD
jgi:hypothetical protein